MGLYGLLEDDEPLSYLGVRQSVGDVAQHFGLPWGEAARAGHRRDRPATAPAIRIIFALVLVPFVACTFLSGAASDLVLQAVPVAGMAILSASENGGVAPMPGKCL